MEIPFGALLDALSDKGEKTSPEDFADAIWLSTRLFDISEKTQAKQKSQREEVSLPMSPGLGQEIEKPAVPKKQIHDDSIPSSELTSTPNIHAYSPRNTERKIKGYSIQLPAAPLLPQMLEIERALRPLNKRTPSKQKWEMDEEATANFIASSGIWTIIKQPAKERWLDGVLVIEQSPTMRIWQEMIKEFRQLLWRVGAFRWLDTVYVDAFDQNPRIISPIDNHQNRSPQSICKPDSSRLIFYCTDCLSNAWLSGQIPHLLAIWEKQHPTVVLQMLPEQMWERTSLRKADFIEGFTSIPATSPRTKLTDEICVNTKPIPVVPIQPRSLRDLSKFLIAAPGNRISCYLNNPDDFNEITEDFSHYVVQNDKNSADQVKENYEQFKETVSPITHDLARNLSVVPLYLPIMRLVQYTFSPMSTPASLAELFNSGILIRVSESSQNENANQIEYDFLPGIRETLLNQKSKVSIAEVWVVLSKYINDRFGHGQEFSSILYNPKSIKEYATGMNNESQKPFARVGAVVLRRLGDEYAEAAKYLEEVANFGSSRLPIDEDLQFEKTPLEQAEILIKKAIDKNSTSLDLSNLNLTELPPLLCELKKLETLNLSNNKLSEFPVDWPIFFHEMKNIILDNNKFSALPLSFVLFQHLQKLSLSNNQLSTIPEWFCYFLELHTLNLDNNNISEIPQSLTELMNLRKLNLFNNQITNLPFSSDKINQFEELTIDNNPIDPKLILELFAKKENNEYRGKLIIVGDSGVGKTTLLRTISDNQNEINSRPSQSIYFTILLNDSRSGRKLNLNCFELIDHGIYSFLGNSFLASPAIFLVVGNAHEPSQSSVKEWIRQILKWNTKAKIIVVATHGGSLHPIKAKDYLEELRRLFGKEIVVDFLLVDNEPDMEGNLLGIEKLKRDILKVAFNTPDFVYLIPKNWKKVSQDISNSREFFMSTEQLRQKCLEYGINNNQFQLFLASEQGLGYLMFTKNNTIRKNLIVLRPDWLFEIISNILDDAEIRVEKGVVNYSRLERIWNIFCKRNQVQNSKESLETLLLFMKSNDLCYRIPGISRNAISKQLYIFPHLLPNIRPTNLRDYWPTNPPYGKNQQIQICQIFDAQNSQTTYVQELFFRLICRLHKYSHKRKINQENIYWSKGLLLEDQYNGCALLELIGNDVRITVRGTSTQFFMKLLTNEIEYLVQEYWPGSICKVLVPCIEPCGENKPGFALFNVKNLEELNDKGISEIQCPVCNSLQNVSSLLNIETNRKLPDFPVIAEKLFELVETIADRNSKYSEILLNDEMRQTLSINDKNFTNYLKSFSDLGKSGPRLFSLTPIENDNKQKNKSSDIYLLTLWCEHSRQPLPCLNEEGNLKGVYEIELTQDWFRNAGPYLKILTSILYVSFPEKFAESNSVYDESLLYANWDELRNFWNLANPNINQEINFHFDKRENNYSKNEHTEAIHKWKNAMNVLHSKIKSQDPKFGGLIPITTRHQEILWIHRKFENEY